MKIWPRIKLGAIPFIVAAIIFFLSEQLWNIVLGKGLNLTGNNFLDVPINLAIILAAIYLLGFLFEKQSLQEFAKIYFHKVPIFGPMLLLLILPRKLELVQIKSTPGNFGEEGCWEYAIVVRDAWEEGGLVWYRVHTLGWTGKLYSRISASNVRPTNRPARDVWASVFSMGLL